MRGLCLVLVGPLASCSLLLGSDDDLPDAGQDVPADAARELGDPEPTPGACARELLFFDSFNDGLFDDEVYDRVLVAGATAIEAGDALAITTPEGAADPRGTVTTIASVDTRDGQLTADLTASTFATGYDHTFGAVLLDGMGAELATVEVGQIDALNTRIGYRIAEGGNPQITGAVNGPTAFGRWRIRLASGLVHIEQALGGGAFIEAAVVPIPPVPTRVQARFVSRGINMTLQETIASFGFFEQSRAPEGGWCPASSLGYLPSRGETDMLFSERVVAAGNVLSGTNVELVANGLTSRSRFNFEASAVVIQIVDVVANGEGRATVEFRRNHRQRFGFEVNDGALEFYRLNGGERATFGEVHDGTGHQFLRVAHTAAGLAFAKSSNGLDWTDVTALPIDFPITDVEVEMRALANGAAGTQLSVGRIAGELP